MRITGWQDGLAGPGGPVGVGAGWGSATAWLAAAAVLVSLLVLVSWAVGRGRRGRGAELALRRYDLQRPAAPDRGVDAARRGQRRRRR
ncbi:MAG: hypothetical protein ACLGI3_13800 [Actinomycetes bacterium]